jgi:protein gp37
MNKTGISYLDFTWNPTKGCSKISETILQGVTIE